MNDLIQEITPLTRAIVWLRPEDISAQDHHYQAIDYLLNGLLTATLKENASPSTLLVGTNFANQLYVFATKKEYKRSELESFFTLLSKDMKAEERVLIVDDVNGRDGFLKQVPEKLHSHFHVL